MTKPIAWALCAVMILAGCGTVAESRLNPMNWFGRSEAAEVSEAVLPTDGRDLVAQIVSLRAEPVPGGAIIRASGLTPRQGYFDGELVPIGKEAPTNGVLAYEFRISAPPTATLVGPSQSREVLVGRFVSNQTLQGVRQIRVRAASNALAVRR